MKKFTILFTMLSVFIQSATSVWAHTESKNEKADDLKIVVTLLEIDNNTLNLSYEIRNNSQQEIWICENSNVGSSKFEVYMADDDQTLQVRRRLDVPMEGFGEQKFGRYTRIRIGEIQKESLSLPLPVRPQYIFAGLRYPQPKNIEHAKQLLIEIGFYSGNLPTMIFDLLNDAEKDLHKKHIDDIGYPTDAVG